MYIHAFQAIQLKTAKHQSHSLRLVVFIRLVFKGHLLGQHEEKEQVCEEYIKSHKNYRLSY